MLFEIMSELANFFNKKKEKKKSKVVQLQDVEKKLAASQHYQDELEKEEAGEYKKGGDDRTQEESEWLDYDNSTFKPVEGLRIKDITIDDIDEEEEHVDEEKQVEKEATKTWGTIESKTAPEIIPTAAEVAEASKAKKFVPSQMRAAAWSNSGNTGGRIDINNQEMFPTFAAAEQIEKHNKEETKWSTAGKKDEPAPAAKPGVYVPPRGDAWGTGPVRSTRDREDAMSAVRSMVSGSGGGSTTPVVRPPHPPEVTLKKSENAYVPPHLRNQQ